MEPFVERLIEEKNQLEEKTAKLDAFLKSPNVGNVTHFQYSVLNVQVNAMRTYLACLDARIKDLT